MPFNRSHLNQGAVAGALGQITTYFTDDRPGAVEAPGYFDAAAIYLRDRDPLIVNYGDDVRLYRINKPGPRKVTVARARSAQGVTNGRKVLTFGDSRIQEGHRAFAGPAPVAEIATQAASPLIWAMALGLDCAHDVWHDVADPRRFTGANHGVTGERIDEMLGRIDAALAMRPDWIVTFPGGNDLTQNRPVDDIIRDQRLLFERILSAGVGLVLGPVMVRDAAAWPDNESDLSLRRRPKLHLLNRDRYQWFLENQHRGRLIWFPLDRDYLDGTATMTVPRVDATRDGTHFTNASAYRAGKRLKEMLTAFIPPGPRFIAGGDDLYDAATNPWGSLLENPLMQGTNGTFKANNGISGTFAGNAASGSRWYLERNYPANNATGTTVVGSVEAADDLAGRFQVLTFAPAPGTGGDVNPFHKFFLRPGTTTASTRDIQLPPGVGEGQWIQMHARIQLSKWAGWGRTEIRCEVRDSARGELIRATGFYPLSYVPTGAATEAFYPYENEAMDLAIRTPPLRLPAGAFFLRPVIWIAVDATIPGTPVARIGEVAIKPVADPRPLWAVA